MIYRSLFPVIAFVAILAAGTTNAEAQRPTSQPYTGDLSIFEDPKRDANLQVDRVMDLLELHPGASVADIGAGSGWFTVRAARRVGGSGKVYAVEINPEFIAHIAKRAKSERLNNIGTVLSTASDPKLPRNGVDAVLLLKTYHEIAKPRAFLQHLHADVRAGGLVGIIDRNGKGDDHGVDAAIVIEEMRRAGFALKSQQDFVKADGDDYFLVFTRVP